MIYYLSSMVYYAMETKNKLLHTCFKNHLTKSSPSVVVTVLTVHCCCCSSLCSVKQWLFPVAVQFSTSGFLLLVCRWNQPELSANKTSHTCTTAVAAAAIWTDRQTGRQTGTSSHSEFSQTSITQSLLLLPLLSLP